MEAPPHDAIAERALMSAVLTDPRILGDVSEHVAPQDFYGPQEAATAALLWDIDAEGKAVEIVSVARLARKRGQDDLVPSDYLASLLDQPVVSDPIELAVVVRQKARQRRLLAALHRLTAEGRREHLDVPEWVSEVEQTVYDLAQDVEVRRDEDTGEIAQRVLETINNRAHGSVDFIPTTLPDLNRVIRGLMPGKLTIIAAKPGNGKTAWLLQEAIAIAKRGEAVVFVSIEMTRDELVERAISRESGVSNDKLLTGEVKDSWATLVAASDEISDLPIALIDRSAITVSQIRSLSRRSLTRLRRKMNNPSLKLGAIMVDYLQLVQGPGEGEALIAGVSIGLTALAKDTGAAVIAAAQFNRDSRPQAGSGKIRRPQITDLRGSGQIEQDAHTILFIHNEESHLPRQDQSPNRTIIVEKNRKGNAGDVVVSFDGPRTRFLSVERNDYDPDYDQM